VLHHEVELAVVIKGYVIVQILALCWLSLLIHRRGRKIEEKDAMNYVAGIFCLRHARNQSICTYV
jgi:2-keto-4-pentenoate hydratase/2-oxohepta-3-ene-1,7-dioic acid hydratase in catechol pathway